MQKKTAILQTYLTFAFVPLCFQFFSNLLGKYVILESKVVCLCKSRAEFDHVLPVRLGSLLHESVCVI